MCRCVYCCWYKPRFSISVAKVGPPQESIVKTTMLIVFCDISTITTTTTISRPRPTSGGGLRSIFVALKTTYTVGDGGVVRLQSMSSARDRQTTWSCRVQPPYCSGLHATVYLRRCSNGQCGVVIWSSQRTCYPFTM